MERDIKGKFIIGKVETQEEKLKRGIAIKEAWKTRKDYIGDLKSKYPKIYNVWRAFMFTEKGKRQDILMNGQILKLSLKMFFLLIRRIVCLGERIQQSLFLKIILCG